MNGLDVRPVLDSAYTALYCAAEDQAGHDLAEQVLQAGIGLAALIEVSDRTIRAFEALGMASSAAATLKARRECIASMVALKAARDRVRGPCLTAEQMAEGDLTEQGR